MISTLLTWVSWLGFLAAPVAAVAAIYLLPSAKPVLDWLGTNVPKLLDRAWNGLDDILDNANTLLLVLALMLGSFMYGKHTTYQSAHDSIWKDIRANYTLLNKKRK
jgi:hypothetical protein